MSRAAEIIEQPFVVIGGGVVGLAIARLLAQQFGPDQVALLEKNPKLGQETTARNSEVIHAGFNNPPDSLKSSLCVRGSEVLYDYCRLKQIPHQRLGKIVVATQDSEVEALEKLMRQGQEAGVNGLRWLSQAQVRQLEPAVRAQAAFLSSRTGIIDSHRLVAALKVDAEANGALIAVATPVGRGKIRNDGQIELSLDDGTGTTLLCSTVINAAGLYAADVARGIEGFPAEKIPPRHLAKGHYFSLRGPSPFSHLVYPVPDPAGGLGIHVTLDLAGQARFGPDISTVPTIDYAPDPERAAQFYPAIRRYYPALADGDLQPDFTGIRPKIGPPGSGFHDFMIQGPAEHGARGLFNLFGIESPGLTACLSLAQYVLQLIIERSD